MTTTATTAPPERELAHKTAPLLIAAGVLIAAAVIYLAAVDGAVLDVLRSAWKKDAEAPANAALFERLIAEMQGNWYWFLLATVPFAVVVLISALMLGIRSASDWVFRLAVGLVALIAFAPALVA